jgi:hypothetical protein
MQLSGEFVWVWSTLRSQITTYDLAGPWGGTGHKHYPYVTSALPAPLISISIGMIGMLSCTETSSNFQFTGGFQVDRRSTITYPLCVKGSMLGQPQHAKVNLRAD